MSLKKLVRLSVHKRGISGTFILADYQLEQLPRHLSIWQLVIIVREVRIKMGFLVGNINSVTQASY